MKKIAISQSNYIPWKGYFEMISAVDEFILYDDMQYTRRDWRNRNKIKTPHGLKWLTIPVKVKGKYHKTISEIEIDGAQWRVDHWKSIKQNYSKTPYFREISQWLEELYLDTSTSNLSLLNYSFIKAICSYVGIETKISWSSEYPLSSGRSERLADLCLSAGGAEYISGPAAREYIDASVFERRNIRLTWFDYDKYPEYPQLWGGFMHEVSMLDPLFNCGKDVKRYFRPYLK